MKQLLLDTSISLLKKGHFFRKKPNSIGLIDFEHGKQLITHTQFIQSLIG